MARTRSLLLAGITLIASASANAATLEIVGDAEAFAPDIASTQYSEVRLTLSPDGRTALWFSRDRPGGAGGYDIWISHRSNDHWSTATPVPFNSPGRDFDPAFSADGAFVYFCSDRAGGHGGDDVYRVRFTHNGFGAVEHLGPEVNSNGNEFAPMLSADSSTLIFSSDRAGGAGRQDLFRSRHRSDRFEVAERLPGEINTGGDEFDATLLADGRTLVFARAGDFRTDRVDLFVATLRDGRYDVGRLLPPSINMPDKDTYGPMLDWSGQGRFTFSAQRPGSRGMDLYVVKYQLITSGER
ncbi:hypothetical protein HNQ60_002078 [Povalibacter uvarum]|uniref:WD40-like Beta Propeller Repeat n=1 Tax=Povalibacter uvarum TaxID=732238 RepID=A0A841HLN5_9GAMM|nr:PD40 domain-containing protein [Povalibacter uvarum]MBB6093200.1 hypothetical protein [Povalibacter uvarum]